MRSKTEDGDERIITTSKAVDLPYLIAEVLRHHVIVSLGRVVTSSEHRSFHYRGKSCFHVAH
jgi:hypothetical protein